MKSKLLVLGLIMMLLSVGIASAFSTLSLDKIEFDSNNPDLRGEAFVLYGAENGASQSATFEIADLESALPDGYAINGVGTITSTLSDYRLTYSLEVPYTYNTFYITQQVCGANNECDYFSTIWNPDSSEWCQGITSSDAVAYFTVKNVGQSNFRCVEIISSGKYATFDDPNTRFTDTFTISTSKGTEEVIISDKDSVEKSNNNNIVVKYEGSLTTLKSEPTPQDEIAGWYSPVDNDWGIINYLTPDERRNYLKSSYIYDKFNECYQDGYKWEDCIGIANSKTFDLLLPASYLNSRIESGTGENGELVLVPSSGLLYKIPTFTLTIDADFVGIYRPVGEPVILDINVDDFNEGDASYITVEAKNKAEVDASFSFQWDCVGDFSIDTSNSQQFDAGETRVIRFSVYGQTKTGCSEGSCTLTLEDTENPSESDSEKISLKVCDANQCTEIGEQRCLSSTIQECVEQNGVNVWDSIRSCPSLYDCRVEGGYGVCVGDEDKDPVCDNGICEAGEQKDGDFECLADCPLPPKPPNPFNNTVIWVSAISGIGILGAVGLRLKKDGYFKGK